MEHKNTNKLDNTRSNLIIINHKKIQLFDNKGEVLVSVEDYNMLSQYEWKLNNNGDVVNNNNIIMRDLLMKPSKEYDVQHIDGNKLNNIRTNLKFANYKKIQLSKNKGVTYVSLEDYDMLIQYKWYLNDKGDVVNDDNIVMCDLLMKPQKGNAVHYINFNKFDNVRTNLEILDYKIIQLGGERGGFTKVSIEDYDWLSKYTWSLNIEDYVVNSQKQFMHRLIMKPDDLLVVDHIKGIRNDNRKEMLKIKDKSANSKNRLKTANDKSSKYKGVSFYNNKGKYFVRIKIDGEEYGIGNYLTEEEAAFAYDMYIVHEKLEDYNLNFPEKRSEYLKTPYIRPQKRKFTSNYEGVGLSKNKKKYTVRITSEGKIIKNFSSYDELECAIEYDKCVTANNLPGKKLNFPENYPDYNPRKVMTFCEDFVGIINKGKVEEELVKLEDNVVKLVSPNIEDEIILIDSEDYEKIKYYGCSTNRGYVTVNGYFGSGHNALLHRLIMNFPTTDMDVDHIGRNTFDNRKKSLKVIPHSMNSQNISKKPGTSSQYIGVSNIKDKDGNPTKIWVAYVSNNRINNDIGRFNNEEYAARKRDLYIKENFPNENYNNLNFKWTDEDVVKWREILKMENLDDQN